MKNGTGLTAFAVTLAALSLAYGPVTASANTFGGRAYAAQATTLTGSTTYADTGPLLAAGGSLSASLQSITSASLSSGPATCGTSGSGSTASSTSSVTNVSAFAGLGSALGAALVSSRTDATCTAATGSSTISGLVFAGLAVTVTGAANQTVSVPLVGSLVINEQIVTSASALTVNALHLTLLTGEELIIASSHSDLACTTPARSSTWGALKSHYN